MPSHRYRSVSAAALLLLGSAVPPAFAAAVSQPQQKPFVDPVLRLALQRDGPVEFVPGPEPAPDSALSANLLLLDPFTARDRQASVFIRLGEQGTAALDRHGAIIGTRVGDWVTARVSHTALPALVEDVSIRAVHAAPTAVPINDRSTADIGASGVRALREQDFTGFSGQGVVIGIIDTGLDLVHADFIAPTGESRVVRLWNQTGLGNPPAGFGYGDECLREEIDAGACTQRDVAGHGTHVTGTAAGNGRATGNGEPAFTFTGVAPEALLVIVKTDFTFGGIVDGLAYIFDVAEELGRPAVVNMSLGSDFGSHDGTRPWELMIDGLVGPGRIAVAAAGNSGSNPVAVDGTVFDRRHAMGTVQAGDTLEHEILMSSGQLVIDLWYDGADSLSFIVEAPRGSHLATATGLSATRGTAEGDIKIETSAEPDPGNGDREAVLSVGRGVAGVWRLRVAGLEGDGDHEPYHAWIVTPRSSYQTGFTNSHLIATPASATRMLAVGAYTTRETWTSADGVVQEFIGRAREGQITAFSSPGPRRDGVLKPDIAGPGSAIGSSLSGSAAGVPGALLLPDGRHWVLRGTSMSAPHATGTIALYLESNPELTPEQVREIFATTAREDEFAGESFADDAGRIGVPNHSWGYGKLAVRQGLEALIGTEARLTATAVGEPPERRVPRRAPDVVLLETRMTTGPDFVEVTEMRLQPEGDLDFETAVDEMVLEPFGVRLMPDGAGGFRNAEPFRIHANSEVRARVVARFGGAGEFGDAGRLRLTDVTATGGVSGVPITGGPPAVAGWQRELARGQAFVDLERVEPPDRPVRGGMAVPVVRLEARTEPIEPLEVARVALVTEVEDPELRIYVARPATGDTVYRSEPFESERAGTAFRDSTLTIALPITEPDEPVAYEIGYLLSPQAAHGSPVGMRLAVDSLGVFGAVSGDSARIETAAPVAAAAGDPVNLLEREESLGLSSNPVRGSRLVLTFDRRPRAVSVFNFAGERVRRFGAGIIEGVEGGPARIVWQPLTNDAGSSLANGVYLLIVEHADGRVERQRLMVLRGEG